MAQMVSQAAMTGSMSAWEIWNSTATTSSEGARWRRGTAPGVPTVLFSSISQEFNLLSNSRIGLTGLSFKRNHVDSGQPTEIHLGVLNHPGPYPSETIVLDLSNVYFPVGKWVVVPQLKNPLQGNINNNYGWIAIYAEYTFIDFQVRNSYVYPWSELPGNAVIDFQEASFVAAPPNADLITPINWDLTFYNETVDELTWTIKNPAGVTIDTLNDRAIVPSIRDLNYSFPTAGNYNVTLKSENESGQSVQTSQTVTVPSGAYIAAYNYEVSYLDIDVDAGVSTGLNRLRLDGVTHTIDTYDWDWGDGTPHGTTKVAGHAYGGGGDYPVKLTITNDLGQTDTETKTVHIDDIPVAEQDFQVEKDFLVVEFLPAVTTGTFSWDFGDGSPLSTSNNPTHTYELPDLYNVTLTWTPQGGGTPVPVTKEVLVVTEYTKIDRFVDALRLEISLPPEPGEPYNYNENPNGELGGYWYNTPQAAGKVRGFNAPYKGISGWKLVLETAGGSAINWETEKIRVDPGEYVNWSIQTFGTGWYRIRWVWYNVAGVLISSSTQSAYFTPTGVTRVGVPALAPANTVYAALRLDYYSTNAGANPTATNYLIYRRVMMSKASTSGELTTLPYTDSANWLDVMGESFDITIDREGLDVGILQAMVRDSSLDPSRTEQVRPGQKVRLRAATQDQAGNEVWENIYSGELDNAKVEYERMKLTKQPDGTFLSEDLPEQTVVQLLAYDRIKRTAGETEPRGVTHIIDLPYVLEGHGVPWIVNGSSDQVPSAALAAWNDNAKLIDQIAVTRDTDLGYAYVNRNDVLVAWDPVVMPTQVVGAFNEEDYVEPLVDFDVENCINSVGIKFLKLSYNVDEDKYETEEIAYGPFVNQDSIDEWGLHHKDFTIQGIVSNPEDAEDYADDILLRNSVPQVRVHAISMPIVYGEDIRLGKAVLDLYDLVNVKYSHSEIDDDMRVTKIAHRISSSPRMWAMAIGFTHDGSTASPQVIPSPPPPTPQADPASPIMKLAKSSDQNVLTATWTHVTLEVDSQRGDISASSSSINIQVTGWYQVNGIISFANEGGTGVTRRIIRIEKTDGAVASGTELVTTEYIGTGVAFLKLPASEVVLLNAGDSIRMVVFQNSGVTVASRVGSRLSAALLK